MAITPTILKLHLETDLATAELQRLIDDADKEISDRFGSDTAITEEHILESMDGRRIPQGRIWLKRRAVTITSVKEGVTFATADLTTLTEDATSDGFRLAGSGAYVERIGTDFLQRVEVVYAPVSDTARRDRVTIDLCKLGLQYNALGAEKVGDWSGNHLDYQQEREALLSTLNAGRRLIA